jgi:hypothetical protein
VSIAIQKWKVNVTSLYNLFEHWLQCYNLFEQDKMHLEHLYELRYEDYVENPGKYHQEIAAFLGTHVPEPPEQDKFRIVTKLDYPSGLRVPEMSMEQTSGVYNKKYFDRWRHLLTKSPFKAYYRYIARRYQPRFAKYGYSLTKDLGIDDEVIKGTKISPALGLVYCGIADTSAMLRRFGTRVAWQIRGQVKAALPKSVVVRIKQVRERAH